MNRLICMLALLGLVTGSIIVFSATYQIQKKHKIPFKTFGIGILLSTLSVPFLINELYKLGSVIGRRYHTLWEAKDVLSFYGSFLAFLGTVALGALALFQNQKFKQENDLAQSRIERINSKLFNLENNREKEKLFEIYFSYLDETQKIFDATYILGPPEEKRSIIKVFSTIKNCHISILSKKRRLIFLDQGNADNDFFQYIEEKANHLTEITMLDENQSQDAVSQLFKFWIKHGEEYNRKALVFITEIHNSIFRNNKN